MSAWPDESAATPILIEKTVKTDPVVLLSGANLSTQRLAKIDVRITWTGKAFRTRTRELTTMISNGGVSRMNHPAMGTAGDTATSTPAPTPNPTATPAPTATPTPTPTNNGNGNGNGNGRGNVAGKPGKA